MFGSWTTLPAGPALLAVGCCAALFEPWARTGAATRSGYAFVRAAQSAAVVHGPWAHLLVGAVLALPVLAGFSCAAAVLRAGQASLFFCGLAGLVVLALSVWLFVKFQNQVPLGPWTGAVLGIAAVATTVRYGREGSARHGR